MKCGKIFFVGAGPGDAVLLTVKGRQVILEADAAIYDKSVSDEIVSMIPDNAKKICIDMYGDMEQEEIFRILEESAKQNKCVVCLKGGVPFLFDADGSYAESLADKGISMEIIPGVLSEGGNEKFPCCENLPLHGWNIVVTRPREISRELVRKMRMLGAAVLEIPAVCLKLVENTTIIDVILKHIWDYQWIIFTSQIGVDAFFKQAKKRQMDVRRFSPCKFAAVGPETKKRLEFYGIIADLMPEAYTIKELGGAMAKILRSGQRVLLVREQDADKQLIRRINRVKNALIEDLPLYKTVSKTISDIPKGLKFVDDFNYENTIIVFSCSLEVSSFVKMFKDIEPEKIKAVCIGEKTQKKAVSFGMQALMVNNEAMADDVVKFMLDAANKARKRS